MSEDENPLKGIRCGAIIRPEPLFHRKSRLIVDTHLSNEHNILRNGLEEVEFEYLKLISLEKLFENKKEVFLGFGLPNVYLTIPNEDSTGYVKFAAFILWRQVSAIVPTKDRVQSGFLIRFRNLTSNQIESIRRSMKNYSNRRFITCAYGNACVLNDSGFRSGGSELTNYFGARSLFQQIFENGLEYQDQSIDLDFIRTTSLTLEEHFHQVRRKELTSLGRTYQKVTKECFGSNEKIRAPLLDAKDIPINPILHSDHFNTLVTLQISRPRRFGAIIRKIWGSHTLFQIIPNEEKIDINQYLPETLRAFPLPNPDLFTRIKKNFLFSRFVVMILRNGMAALWDNHGLFNPSSLASMMSIHTKKSPHPYNIIITGNHLIGMHNNPFFDWKFVNWILSKHVLISGYDDDVRFAGEAWMEHQINGLTLHLTNNSGTYKPTKEHLEQARLFLNDALPGLTIQTHENIDTKQQKNGFHWKSVAILFLPLIVYFIFKLVFY